VRGDGGSGGGGFEVAVEFDELGEEGEDEGEGYLRGRWVSGLVSCLRVWTERG